MVSPLIPEDHILKRVDEVLDLSWIHEEVRGCYCQDNGRGSIDPESALRLMLAGTRIRQRWGEELFRKVFQRGVGQCVEAGLVNAETIDLDPTLIRADVSWNSLTTRYVDRVIEENCGEEEPSDEEGGTAKGPGGLRAKGKEKKYSPTDPDATMATSCKQYHLEPSYKQYTAVEDKSGIIVDVMVTTGEAHEGQHLLEQIERIEATTGATVKAVTGDSAYAHGNNYEALEEKEIDAIIPPQRPSRRKNVPQRIPARRFKYDARKGWIKCPAGKYLHRTGRSTSDNGYGYRARFRDCKTCPLRERCIAPSAHVRHILIVDGFPSLLRARRRREKGWDEPRRDRYTPHPAFRGTGRGGPRQSQDPPRSQARGTPQTGQRQHPILSHRRCHEPETPRHGLLETFFRLYAPSTALQSFPTAHYSFHPPVRPMSMPPIITPLPSLTQKQTGHFFTSSTATHLSKTCPDVYSRAA